MSHPTRAGWMATGAILWLLLGCMAAAAACQRRPPAAGGAAARATESAVTDLLERVRQKDFTATLRARELGPEAASGLTPLVRDPDPVVRQLALLCVLETGAPSALNAAFGALADDDPQVRSVALRGLGELATRSHATRVVEALRDHAEPETRRELAVIVGALGERQALEPLRAACARHSDPETQRGCLVARAWLGEAAAQEEFGGLLQASSGRERIDLLDHADRIRARWLLPYLGVLLEDTGPARWIGVDGLPGPETLRVCDVAVNLIAAITQHRFGFAVGPKINYLPSNLAEVARYLRASR